MKHISAQLMFWGGFFQISLLQYALISWHSSEIKLRAQYLNY